MPPGFISGPSDDSGYNSYRNTINYSTRQVEPRKPMMQGMRSGPILETEPIETGRAAWDALTRSCSLLRCSKCRKDCQSFINGLHDVVNVKLGKQMVRPMDFVFLQNAINATYEYAFEDSHRF
jgi:hypothetical protein